MADQQYGRSRTNLGWAGFAPLRLGDRSAQDDREAMVVQRIVVAAKAGRTQPWVAHAAAELAGQTGAAVAVVSADGLDVEALSPVPALRGRRARGERGASGSPSRSAPRASRPTAQVLPGRSCRSILLFAEEHDADLIVAARSTPRARRAPAARQRPARADPPLPPPGPRRHPASRRELAHGRRRPARRAVRHQAGRPAGRRTPTTRRPSSGARSARSTSPRSGSARSSAPASS